MNLLWEFLCYSFYEANLALGITHRDHATQQKKYKNNEYVADELGVAICTALSRAPGTSSGHNFFDKEKHKGSAPPRAPNHTATRCMWEEGRWDPRWRRLCGAVEGTHGPARWSSSSPPASSRPPSSPRRSGALDGTIRPAAGVPPLLPSGSSGASDRAGLLLGSGGCPPLPWKRRDAG